jgi:RNA polymerase sigma-70 factor (sigma-E family)
VSQSGQFDEEFIALYRSEYPNMVRLAISLTGDPDIAEDVAQDAFARVQGRLSSLENPGGYLRTVVVNLCRDRHRRRSLERRHPPPAPDGLSLQASELVDTLMRLPFKQRAVLVLRYWGDWTEAEIAEAVDCRPGTVKTLASRGLAALRKEVVQ